MAGGHSSDIEYKGWQKIFNTTTLRGRLHCAYASMALWTSIFVAVKFWPSKSKSPKEISS